MAKPLRGSVARKRTERASCHDTRTSMRIDAWHNRTEHLYSCPVSSIATLAGLCDDSLTWALHRGWQVPAYRQLSFSRTFHTMHEASVSSLPMLFYVLLPTGNRVAARCLFEAGRQSRLFLCCPSLSFLLFVLPCRIWFQVLFKRPIASENRFFVK